MNESGSKRILVTGASGLVGQALTQQLCAAGDQVFALSHRPGSDFYWNIEKRELNAEIFSDMDSVIHLAGETVAQRWTASSMKRIRNSRVEGTKLLVERIVESGNKPNFICASGINYYGYDSGVAVDESTPSGAGFLADVCREWEGAAQGLESHGCRCVYVRTGVVLSQSGGALKKMLPAFRSGAGGPIGDGSQKMSWVDLDDLVRIFLFCLSNGGLSGPINAVAPSPVSNRAFAKALGAALNRPAILPLPKLAVSLIFGLMAKETLLSNLSVLPKKLNEFGFEWSCSTVEESLNKYLK